MGYSSEALHGDISQAQREKIIRRFKAGRLSLVIATDVASRGVDVKGLNHVINYELPQDVESYVHRIGRTGRAGNTGKAISLISPREFSMLNQIMRVTKADIKKEKVPSVKDIIESQKSTLVESVTAKVAELSADNKKASLAEYVEVASKLIDGADCVNTLMASVLHLVSEGMFEAKNYPEIQEINGGRRRSRDGARRGDRRDSRRAMIARDGRRGDRRDSRRGDRSDRRSGRSRFSQSNDKTRIFVAQGLKQKTNRNDLVNMIVNKTSTNKAKITNVRVFDDFSFITVPNNEANKILKKFSSEKSAGDHSWK